MCASPHIFERYGQEQSAGRRRSRTPLDFVTVFDDFSAHIRPAEAPAEVAADQQRQGLDTAGKTAQNEGVGEWSVSAAQITGGAADVSTELTEEEEQEYLRQLEQKRAARGRQKREAEQQRQEKPVRSLDAFESKKEKHGGDLASQKRAATASTDTPHFPAASHASSPAVTNHPKQAPAAATRKFRVLPSVGADQTALPTPAAICTQIEPRILEVKVVGKSDYVAAALSPKEHTSQQDESVLSPFSAFYYETMGVKKMSDCRPDASSDTLSSAQCIVQTSGKVDMETSQFSAVDKASQGDKSVHFASVPQLGESDVGDVTSQQRANASPTTGSPESLAPSTESSRSGQGLTTSRELSLAPKAQRIWPIEAQIPAAHVEGSESTSVSQEAPSLTAAHELVRQSSLSVVNALMDIDAYKAGSHDTLNADKSCDSTVLPARSPKATSWSGIGVKLEPIRSSNFRSRNAALLGGLEVIEMDLGGPAEMSGIKVGDVIVQLSNGVLARGTSAMEATSLLRQQPYPYQAIVSRRQHSWGKQGKVAENQGVQGSPARKLISLCIQGPGSDAAFGTDLSAGFTLRDCKQDQEEDCLRLPMVSDLIDGSSAHRSGLRIGDVLMGVGSLHVCKMPARASISLLLGEAGSPVLLGIHDVPEADVAGQHDGYSHASADAVKWLIVERMSGCHVSLEASQAISAKLSDPCVVPGPLLPELSPEDSLESKRHSPSPIFVGNAYKMQARTPSAGGVLSLSPVPSNASHETYFAYRDSTASSSAAVTPDGGALALNAHTAGNRRQAGAARAACLDDSLEELRRQARAREKRQTFLSSLAPARPSHESEIADAGHRANPHKHAANQRGTAARQGSVLPMHAQAPGFVGEHAVGADGDVRQARAATKPTHADGYAISDSDCTLPMYTHAASELREAILASKTDFDHLACAAAQAICDDEGDDACQRRR